VTPPALFHGQCGTNQEKPSARAAISAFVKCT
jgi:hypothetical protein